MQLNVCIITPCAHAQRGNVIGSVILSFCPSHENRHFGKSRQFGETLARLFNESLQKTVFSPIQIV